MSVIDDEADKIATREYLAKGQYGGVSKAKGGVVTSTKFFDFQEAFIKAKNYLIKIGFGTIQKEGD